MKTLLKINLAIALAVVIGCSNSAAHEAQAVVHSDNFKVTDLQLVDQRQGFATVKLDQFTVKVMFDVDVSHEHIDTLAILSITDSNGGIYSDFTDSQDHQVINRLLVSELGGVQ